MKQKKKKNRTTSFLEWNEYLKLLKKLKGDKIRLIVAFQGMCGLRVSDVLNLTWGDIANKDNVVLYEKKTGKQRKIFINDDLKRIIAEEYREQDPHIYCFRSKFANEPISIEYINRRYKEFFDLYEIEYYGNISSHLFRKTFGRRYIELNDWSDKSLMILCDVFNHSSLKMTRIYLGINEQEKENVYRMLTL